MKIICGKRQSGKTVEAIKLAAKTGSYMACSSQRECYRVAELARKLGYEIPFLFFSRRLYLSVWGLML